MPARSDDSPWRTGATADEIEMVRRLDQDMAAARALVSTLARQRQQIANRARMRAVYQRQKKIGDSSGLTVDCRNRLR